MGSQLTPARMAIIKRTIKGKRKPSYTADGMQASAISVVITMEISQRKTQTRAIMWPSDPTPGYLSKRLQANML